MIFDAAQPCERVAPFVDVLVLDQHRRLEVAPVGHERVVDIELVLDAGVLERLLDAQHLLDLVADRELVLEEQRHVLPDMDRAIALVREHARAKCLPLPGVGLERQQAVAGYGRHVALRRARRRCRAASTDAACEPCPRRCPARCPARFAGPRSGSRS